VCPVKIDIPRILVHLRQRVVAEHAGEHAGHNPEDMTMKALGRVFQSRRAYEAAQKAGRLASRPVSVGGHVRHRLPGPLEPWLRARDLKQPPKQSFRDWWKETRT
jgi:L-lactate dehydrogenase complex protein LldF